MTEMHEGEGIVLALLERMEKQRLPRALDIKERVDRGELLNDSDIEFLEHVFADASKARPVIDKHPEWHELVTRLLSLYTEITDRALENEKASPSG